MLGFFLGTFGTRPRRLLFGKRLCGNHSVSPSLPKVGTMWYAGRASGSNKTHRWMDAPKPVSVDAAIHSPAELTVKRETKWKHPFWAFQTHRKPPDSSGAMTMAGAGTYLTSSLTSPPNPTPTPPPTPPPIPPTPHPTRPGRQSFGGLAVALRPGHAALGAPDGCHGHGSAAFGGLGLAGAQEAHGWAKPRVSGASLSAQYTLILTSPLEDLGVLGPQFLGWTLHLGRPF